MYEESKKRQPSQKELVLKSLKLAGSSGRLNTELSEIVLRFSHIIYLLRLDGYRIKTENIEGGLVRYILLKNEPDPKEAKKKGIDIVREQWGELGGYYFKRLEAILDKHNLQITHKPNALNKIKN